MTDATVGARTAHEITADIGELTQRVTLKIRGLNVMRLRWMAAAWVFQLGGLIAGCNVEVTDDRSLTPDQQRVVDATREAWADQGGVIGEAARRLDPAQVHSDRHYG